MNLVICHYSFSLKTSLHLVGERGERLKTVNAEQFRVSTTRFHYSRSTTCVKVDVVINATFSDGAFPFYLACRGNSGRWNAEGHGGGVNITRKYCKWSLEAGD